VSPFISVSELARNFVGRVADLVSDRYNNREMVQQVRSPVLVVHGKQDNLVPWKHGQAVFEACRSRKFLVSPEGMGHNTNLHRDTSFFAIPFLSFFAVLPPVQREVHVPLSVYERPRVNDYMCMSVMGVPCCLPRNGPGAAPYTTPVCRPFSVDGNTTAGGRENVGRPRVSKATPIHSSLSEPSYDSVCKPKFVIRSTGDGGLQTWPSDFEDEDDWSDVEQEDSPPCPQFGDVVSMDQIPGIQAATGIILEIPRQSAPRLADMPFRNPRLVDEVVGGMSGAPVLPDLPDAWLAPDDLKVPSAGPVSNHADSADAVQASRPKGTGSSCSQRSANSDEDTREPSEEAHEKISDICGVDLDVGLDQNIIVRFI